MEFPYGHHSHSHHHHHNRREEEEEQQGRLDYPGPPPPVVSAISPFDQPPPPPPPSYFERDEEFRAPPPPPSYFERDEEFRAPPPPPPSQVAHVYHSSHSHFQSPQDFNYAEFPPPPPQQPPLDTTVHHVAHYDHDLDLGGQESETHHHIHRPHLPSFVHHHAHQSLPSDLSNKPTVKVFSKAQPNFSLTIRDGKVILALSDPSDVFQHWYKDEKYSTRVKDEEGFPCFSLINKATGQAMKHSIGATHPVQLVPYVADFFDESILWTESKDLGDGFRTIRMVNNTRLIVDAFHGDKKSGGVHDGTNIVLWAWNKGDNQRWKIIPYCKFLNIYDAV